MILLIDNYDSFTYNLYQYLRELGGDVEVRRHDAIDVDGVRRLSPRAIVLSPGPGRPGDAGVCLSLVSELGATVPILGVCLGHQCVGEAYGGRVVHAGELKHGKTSLVHHGGQGVLGGLPNPFTATRYHSLVVERASLPSCLEVTAETDNGLIMGLRHREHPVEGVQFHPESILTTVGKDLLRNFLSEAES